MFPADWSNATRDNSANTLAKIVVMAFVYLLFGVFILAFKYPKVVIP